MQPGDFCFVCDEKLSKNQFDTREAWMKKFCFKINDNTIQIMIIQISKINFFIFQARFTSNEKFIFLLNLDHLNCSIEIMLLKNILFI